ncbi:MAG: hypothetical protein IKE23_12080 [Exiguobacterium sp.]|nr:hypothetical protein [Exiguobacterium sp.]
MARNKVVYNGQTLIDLTNDTVDSDKLLSGYTAHKADGTQVTGEVDFVTYYTGSTNPSSSLGSNGDIYLKT